MAAAVAAIEAAADRGAGICNLAADSREQADLAPDKPELLAEFKTALERIAGGLLPLPPRAAPPRAAS